MTQEEVLVTGAAGFIGSHVVRELLAGGWKVVALDDLSGGFRQNVDARATFVHGSILDVALVDRLFAEHRFSYVFHLAAYAAEGLSHFIKRFNYQNNLIGSVNLINAAINGGVRCFVFTSSIAVYGSAASPVSEEGALAPEDPYGIAKAAVEQELRVSAEMFGLPYVVFRPHNVYGPGQNIGDRYRNVVGIFMNQILSEEPLTIFGDGLQTRAFTYISDVTPLLVASISRPDTWNHVYNVGSDHPVSVNELGEVVSRAMGVPFRPRHVPARVEVRHIHANHQKARLQFGHESVVGLEQGIGEMARWARSVGARTSQPFAGLEITRNLPPSWRS